MTTRLSKILNNEVRITRCGYTGEDGKNLFKLNHIYKKKVNQILLF